MKIGDKVRTNDGKEGFWSMVECCGDDKCWLWKGKTSRTHSGDYGRFAHDGGWTYAHRFAYESLVGPIPEGLILDHLCRNTLCVNPRHLEPVTHRVNLLRGVGASAMNAKKTHCPQGYPYDEQNTRITWRGYRACRACERETAPQRRAYNTLWHRNHYKSRREVMA